MDLSSPTDCAAGGFDDLFTPRSMQTSSEDVHNRSLSSDTSSSGGRETSARLDRWELIRANAVMFCTCYSYTLIDHCLFMIGLILYFGFYHLYYDFLWLVMAMSVLLLIIYRASGQTLRINSKLPDQYQHLLKL